ncbi:MAG: efflux RND transporter periplasmic adaptor subunit, partial [Planctomycetota bacterium]
GVATKRPKPEEIEEAAVGERQAVESVAVARSELQRLQAAHENVLKDYDRARALARQALIPQADLDAAETAETQAREQVEVQEVRLRIAELAVGGATLRRQVIESRLHDFDWEEKDYARQIEALEASLAKLEDDLKQTEIRAPIDGTILRLERESEQVITAGTPILEMGDLSRLEVEADFLSGDAAHMRSDMRAEIFGRALGDAVLPAKVVRIDPSAFTKISSLGVEQQRVTVTLAVDPAGTGLGDRYRVEVRVILDERPDVLLVPEGALFREGEGWAVFVIEDGRARLRRVETGLRGLRTREVRSGLAEGDVVILHPDDTIEEGGRVAPLE